MVIVWQKCEQLWPTLHLVGRSTTNCVEGWTPSNYTASCKCSFLQCKSKLKKNRTFLPHYNHEAMKHILLRFNISTTTIPICTKSEGVIQFSYWSHDHMNHKLRFFCCTGFFLTTVVNVAVMQRYQQTRGSLCRNQRLKEPNSHVTWLYQFLWACFWRKLAITQEFGHLI